MQQAAVKSIRESIEAARRLAKETTLDGCDLSDIEELMAPLEQELQRPLPNVQTLSTYLNSLLRSLRAQPSAHEVCLQLDEAMRDAGVPRDWRH